MATNSILTFAETGTTADLLTNGEYNADAQRAIGHQPGVARAKLANKAAKQSSLLSAALAQFIADNQSNNISDALSVATLASYLELAVTAMVGENFLNKGYLNVQDQKSNGTAGGTATADTDITRTLNTVVNNTIAGASLASNKITLPAGTYRISAKVPVCNTDSHKAWLKNVTSGATLLVGTSEQANAPAGNPITSSSHITGLFTLAVTAELEVHHVVQSTQTTYGLGYATASTTDPNHEVYTVVEIFKI